MKIQQNQSILDSKGLNLDMLIDLSKKPELFSKGEPLFWDDPHISQKMLEAHLNPTWEAASRSHETIDKAVNWLVKYLDLPEGAKVLDLGCGPGLYCTRFHQQGLRVVGMDYSRNSIRYAKEQAKASQMDIEYIYQNYLSMNFKEEFDAIFLIYCDLGALTDQDRDVLLKKVHQALKPNGTFIFDVFTQMNRDPAPVCSWSACETGFWRPTPHLLLEQRFHYPEENVLLDQYTIIEENGKVITYKVWDHYYTPEAITGVLNRQGLLVKNIWSDLTGQPYQETTKALGLACSKSEL